MSFMAILRPRLWQKIFFYKSSHAGFANVSSAFENRALFPLIEKGIPTHSKNRPACWDAHIGPEENYI